MSWADEHFMQRGYRVRHKYRHSRSRTKTCMLCGAKRRRRPAGWEYLANGSPKWGVANPPCAKKER